MNTVTIILCVFILILCLCAILLVCEIRRIKETVRSLESGVGSIQWSIKRDYDRIVSLFCFIKERCQTEEDTAVAGFDELEREFMGQEQIFVGKDLLADE